MDSDLVDNIDSILSTEWTYFFETIPSNIGDVQAAVYLGYGGATLSIFLSVAGAYEAGASVIDETETSFWAFLKDFQSKDKYRDIMADPEKAEKFQKFLINYSLDMILVILAVFWHIGFLSAMGLVVAYMIYNEMKTLGDGDVNVDIDVAWKMMFFGTLMGAVNYLAGVAVSVNDDTIIKMLGFTPYKDEDEETTKTIEETIIRNLHNNSNHYHYY